MVVPLLMIPAVITAAVTSMTPEMLVALGLANVVSVTPVVYYHLGKVLSKKKGIGKKYKVRSGVVL